MVIQPPIGNSAFQEDDYSLLNKTLNDLRWSPHHLFNTIKGFVLNMGLNVTTWPLPHFWCTCQPILSWYHLLSSIPTPHRPLCWWFRVLLLWSNQLCPIQNITTRTHSSKFHGRCWIFIRYCIYLANTKRRNISVHIFQSAFTEFIAHRLLVQSANKVPNMTLLSSGLPIYSIPPIDPLDPVLLRQIQVYHRTVGCINELETCTHPDISPGLTFIPSYRNSPHPHHYKFAVHALIYLTSTNEYGISFHSHYSSPIQELNHFSHHHYKKAYTEATDPSSS